ncbi:MAG: CO dehydrogenase/acetyl-CoA synthase complex subunit alpha [Archaeoglobaceae archaeon]|nr:CO dehydrogenase/acetyl-CoA synthase complex subunit alpha [Archaeoglobaceae archaeon]MCX8151962.1 CO dehydrogenase/acetyl-CoA synthase complex subunit alpha [Archaeoglobaceae archaeon]MDW8013351.1 CO dehydrogenase/acetyl-CoA synthase complex subunit alpha [Archaeoglobaceae archaeon]
MFEIGKGVFVDELRNVSIRIKEIEEEEILEEVGPTPKPGILELRKWDHKLLERYEPFYAPVQDFCNLCTMGPCDLSFNKKGACGIDLRTAKARLVTIACCIGSASHTAHARHIVDHLIEQLGEDFPIDLGGEVNIKAPIIKTVIGIEPKTLGDLRKALEWVEKEIVKVLHSTHIGNEESYIDYESKSMHVSMADHVGMEVADIAQIVAFNFPKAEPNTPLVPTGFGIIDRSKPVIVVVGHNVMYSRPIVEVLEKQGKIDAFEIAGLCCTAHDIVRTNSKAKIFGPISYQLRVIRAGIPDVVVSDEQCIRADLLEACKKLGIPLIATSDAAARGLPDANDWSVEKIVESLISGKLPGVFLSDPEKVGIVAPIVAEAIFNKNGKNRKYRFFASDDEFRAEVSKCTQCMNCVFACPHNLRVDLGMAAAKRGEIRKLASLEEQCLACGKCEQVCPKNIKIINAIMFANFEKLYNKTGRTRVGRGPIQDTEIRKVGQPIVFGQIPGVIAAVGCINFPDEMKSIREILEEFLRRKFIVVTSGCHAMEIGMIKDEEGLTLYEKYPGLFDAGGLVNVGSCVANSHIAGAAIKIANIFAQRKLRGNYAEIADYILNRVGAVGFSWGPYSHKAASIATGFNRLGVPVVVGPHGVKYRRAYIGKPWKREKWWVYDIKSRQKVFIEPAPDCLLVAVETKEEAIVQLARLCIRPNDTAQGRQIKLTHYIELHKKYYGDLPDDWHLYVRTESDLPLKMREELLKVLEEVHGWKIDWNRRKILEGPIRSYDAGFNPTIVEEVYEKYVR